MCVCVCYSSTTSTDHSGQQTTSVDTTAYQESPLKPFVWAGPTVQRLTLSPGSTHVIQQRACFVSAGMYNLNLLRVTAGSVTDIEMVPQRAVSTAPIIVRQVTAMSDSVVEIQ